MNIGTQRLVEQFDGSITCPMLQIWNDRDFVKKYICKGKCKIPILKVGVLLCAEKRGEKCLCKLEKLKRDYTKWAFIYREEEE